jgi:DNA repair exonuclease SbcCD nuclease subunit
MIKYEAITVFEAAFVFQPDMILWTGDINSHNVWEYTKEGNLALMASLTSLFTKYFAGIPVFAAVGNHEEVPCNKYATVYIIIKCDSSPVDRRDLFKSLSHVQFPALLGAAAVQSRLALRRPRPAVERVDTVRINEFHNNNQIVGKYLCKSIWNVYSSRASYMVQPFSGLRIISVNTIYAYTLNL